jgi:hypothetical protein
MTTTGHPAVHDPGPVRRVAARRQVDKQIRGSARTMQGPVSGGNRRTGISRAFPAEVAGCQVHEALLNVAFDAATPFRLLCPYDLEALAADMIDEAHRTPPSGTSDGLAR